MTVLVISTVTFNACTKTIEQQINQAVSGKANGARLEGNTSGKEVSKEDLEDLMNLDNPMRDVLHYLKNGGRLPETKHFKDFLPYFKQTGKKEGIIGYGSYPWGCSSNPGSATGLVVLGYPGAPPCGGPIGNMRISNPPSPNTNHIIDCPTYIQDAFGNKIYVLGMYGTADERQGYYVYLPDNYNVNSKIVVLIHGGAWFVGPNLDYSNGWGSPYSTNPTQNNLVKNLLSQNYAVVVPLYRLVQYGNSNTEYTANPIGILDQVDDIDAAIQHIHSNFPTCLGINANNIQVMGESAGASIALLYAYTKANTSVVKSVVSVAGPTNMNQFADYLNNKPTPLYSCGGNYVLSNPNNTGYTNIPYYLFTDISVISTSVASVSPLNCTLGTISTSLGGTAYPPAVGTNFKVTDSYKLAQSTVKQTVTTPLTSTLFSTISPCVQLNSSRVIPTFIIHGLDDWIVPYNKATNTMDTKLTNTGGLIGIYNNIFPSTIPSSGQYASLSSKHLMKLYYGANHDVSNQSQVLPDIITWFNGH